MVRWDFFFKAEISVAPRDRHSECEDVISFRKYSEAPPMFLAG